MNFLHICVAYWYNAKRGHKEKKITYWVWNKDALYSTYFSLWHSWNKVHPCGVIQLLSRQPDLFVYKVTNFVRP